MRVGRGRAGVDFDGFGLSEEQSAGDNERAIGLAGTVDPRAAAQEKVEAETQKWPKADF